MLRKILIKKAKHIHFVGIGGISMSALAKFAYLMKKKVTGSDLVHNSEVENLSKTGISVYIGHKAKNIGNADMVVYTNAVGEDNVELVEARKRNLVIMERAEFLDGISEFYDITIAVSGTHGKTTTTAMIAKIFIDAGLDPCVHLGGKACFLDSNMRAGRGIFITEACEFRKSFLKLKPTISVITNIDDEHLDYYHTHSNLVRAFRCFIKKSKYCYCNYDSLPQNTHATTFSVDNSQSDWTAKNLKLKQTAGYTFDVYNNKSFMGNFETSVIGKHNVLNALCAIMVAKQLNIPDKIISSALISFLGVSRRFEKYDKVRNADIIHDYAHHPTEITQTISSFREFYRGELVVIFEPHTYSRTQNHFDLFVEAFNSHLIDKIIFLPTYPAREKLIASATSKSIYKEVAKKQKTAYYFGSKAKLFSYLNDLCDSQTTLLFMGAGPIENTCKEFVKKCK